MAVETCRRCLKGIPDGRKVCPACGWKPMGWGGLLWFVLAVSFVLSVLFILFLRWGFGGGF